MVMATEQNISLSLKNVKLTELTNIMKLRGQDIEKYKCTNFFIFRARSQYCQNLRHSIF